MRFGAFFFKGEKVIEFRNIVIRTTVEPDLKTGDLEVWVEAHNDWSEKADLPDKGKIFLWAYLANEEDGEADRIFPISAETQMQFCMRVENPHLWNAEECCLYDLNLELRDEENRLLGCTVKKIAFFRWEEAGGTRRLNGKNVKFRLGSENAAQFFRNCDENDAGGWKNAAERVLGELKLSDRNALYVEKRFQSPALHELCLEYGVYLLDKMPSEGEVQKNEDHFGFELQVVEQGVLIENRNVFADASIYDLYYEILCGEKTVQSAVTQAKVAAGSSRFIELPFAKPKDPGVYRYRAALCLKRDTVWAKKGYEVAKDEAVISNLWLE